MRRDKIKVVIDTNVLISSLWGGKPYTIIQWWDNDTIQVFVSQEILDEYFNVLNRFNLIDEDIEDLSVLFSHPDKTVIVNPKVKINIIKKDPADNKFLECAIEGKVDFLISGDKHLLNLGFYKRIPIISPHTFIEKTKS